MFFEESGKRVHGEDCNVVCVGGKESSDHIAKLVTENDEVLEEESSFDRRQAVQALLDLLELKLAKTPLHSEGKAEHPEEEKKGKM